MQYMEENLSGGQSGVAVVKVKNTVRRELGKNSKFVHKLLQFLEKTNFAFAPKFLGVDEKGREILTYIEGEISHGGFKWKDTTLVQIVQLLRKFHDITAGSELAGSSEVVCHNDFAPWNVVMKDEIPAGIIDFDGASPGKRIDDIAYTLWTFLGLGDESKTQEYLEQIGKLVVVYGDFDTQSFVSALLKHQASTLAMRRHRAVNDTTEEARDFSANKVKEIEKEIQWTKNNTESLRTVLLQNSGSNHSQIQQHLSES